jgi:hypothetical protein
MSTRMPSVSEGIGPSRDQNPPLQGSKPTQWIVKFSHEGRSSKTIAG